jgi:hypothetical protein
MTPILIAGGGPAGACAALAALAEGAAVRLFEKSLLPRHKVCGEFLSPEIEPALASISAWGEVQNAAPAVIRSVKLHFGRFMKNWPLTTPAFGLSRYRLDRLLLDRALASGAELTQEAFHPNGQTAIIAHGRRSAAPKGDRLFGFKAHFSGPSDDAVELFFRRRGYAGVSCVESQMTNVCGLAPESLLSHYGFEIDDLIHDWKPLRNRIAPLSRTMDWMITGPLVYGRDREDPAAGSHYRAGDALGFVDPFTGSGILSAVITGKLAGSAAARGISPRDYLGQCRDALRIQYWMSGLARFAIWSGAAEVMARWLPGELLFALTRPKIRNR